MVLQRFFFKLLGLLLLITPGTYAFAGLTAGAVTTGHAQVELVAEHDSIQPGQPFDVAFRMELEPGWHTYWLNAGDSGLPLRLQWHLPEGFTAGPIQWPKPEAIELPPYLNYGYHDRVAMLVTITPPTHLAPGSMVNLSANASWLICREICLPEQAQVGLMLPVTPEQAQPEQSKWAEFFKTSRSQLPKPWSGGNLSATANDEKITLAIEGSGPFKPTARPYFFAADGEVIEYAADQNWQMNAGGGALELQVSSFAATPITKLRGLLTSGFDQAQSWEIDLPVTWTGQSQNQMQKPAVPGLGLKSGSTTKVTQAETGFWLALIFAFVGGMILNLMPCVFPILSIKILSFVSKASGNSGKLRAHGLLFAAGVLISFWILLALLLVLRGLGEQLGWGFQLQSPLFVALIALLTFGIGLNLLGVFETGLGLATAGGNTDPGKGYAGSFFTGVLTTAVASPCTAPFMGVALGYALTQPAWVSATVFTALGLGMAAPYLLLLEIPSLLARLPKPGPWMDTLKQILAFPMFLTSIWLLWVLGRQSGVDALTILLLVLLSIAGVVWYYGRRQRRGAIKKRLVAGVIVVSCIIIALGLRGMAHVQQAAGISQAENWLPYTELKLNELRQQGKNIFVDFTAAWCITCQVNKTIALNADAVEEKFRDLEIVRLRGDWTSQNPEITETLAKFGRSGVPLNLFYPAGAEPVVLPAILTPQIVIDTLEGHRK